MSRLPAFASVVLAAAMLLLEPASAAAQQEFNEQEIRTLVEGLRNGTLSPAYASEECRMRVQDSDNSQDVAEIMAGYLRVPEDMGAAAFCAALTQAIKNDDVALESLFTVIGRRDGPERFFELGRLLRAIYFSHYTSPSAGTEAELPR